jgi:hypothetical protein
MVYRYRTRRGAAIPTSGLIGACPSKTSKVQELRGGAQPNPSLTSTIPPNASPRRTALFDPPLDRQRQVTTRDH